MLKQRIVRVCGAALLAALPASAPAQQILLDRVVARVNGSAVLLTDVRAAVGLGLVEAPPDSEDAVEQFVQRALLLDEVSRFSIPEPATADVDAEAARLRGLAGGRLEEIKRATALTDDQIRLFARDSLRIRAYLDERFGTSVPIAEEQVLQYYRDHPDEFRQNGVLPPFDQVQAQARAAAGLERRRGTIAQWLGDLRARGNVTIVEGAR